MSGLFNTENKHLYVDGVDEGLVYSGHGEGLNNWAFEHVKNVGPIPRGLYHVSDAFTHPTKGPLCFRLTPAEGTEVYDRDGFLIHGDNAKLDHSASEGCVIAGRAVRQFLSDYKLKLLEVK